MHQSTRSPRDLIPRVLRALQTAAEELAAQDAAERSAFASLELARNQLRVQTTDYLTVLVAERT